MAPSAWPLWGGGAHHCLSALPSRELSRDVKEKTGVRSAEIIVPVVMVLSPVLIFRLTPSLSGQ